jgi:hypothetical protein
MGVEFEWFLFVPVMAMFDSKIGVDNHIKGMYEKLNNNLKYNKHDYSF